MCRYIESFFWGGVVFLLIGPANMVYGSGGGGGGPKVEVTGIAWSENQLVIGLMITAPHSAPLTFGSDETEKGGVVKFFTTKESWLVDLHSGQKIAASKKYPKGPNMGWVKLCDTLAPGCAENFTAAFPAPPLPPVVNGKRQDYQLELHLPGGLPPVAFRVPVPADMSSAP